MSEKIPFLDMFPDCASLRDSCGGLDKAEVLDVLIERESMTMLLHTWFARMPAPVERTNIEQLLAACVKAGFSDVLEVALGAERTTEHETKEFIEKYELTNCFVHLDTFHTNIEEADMAQTILDCGDRLGYFQCADSNRRWPGAGHIDFAAFAEPLRQVDFSGPLSIECQPIPDGVTAARNGIAHLRKTLDI